MTLEEAKKVARVCETADAGCINCVKGLVKELNEQFPEFQWGCFENNNFNVEISVVEKD